MFKKFFEFTMPWVVMVIFDQLNFRFLGFYIQSLGAFRSAGFFDLLVQTLNLVLKFFNALKNSVDLRNYRISGYWAN